LTVEFRLGSVAPGQGQQGQVLEDGGNAVGILEAAEFRQAFLEIRRGPVIVLQVQEGTPQALLAQGPAPGVLGAGIGGQGLVVLVEGQHVVLMGPGHIPQVGQGQR
jgi:hypothetical protein